MFRLPAAYIAFVIMEFAVQPLLLVASGNRLHPVTGAIFVLIVLVIALARGSQVAWGLLVLWTAFTVVAVAALLVPPTASGIAWLAYGGVSLILLLSTSMRRHLGMVDQPASIAC